MIFSSKCIFNIIPLGYAKFFKKHFQLTNFCLNNKDFKNLNKISNTFIVGSDNQINYICERKNISRNLFNWDIS